MPIYEYECRACGKIFERLQKMNDPQPEQCDLCGQGPVRKLISLSGFVLKGGGFYTNEYPSASRRQAQQSETTPASTAPASAPAAKTETSSDPAATAKTATEKV